MKNEIKTSIVHFQTIQWIIDDISLFYYCFCVLFLCIFFKIANTEFETKVKMSQYSNFPFLHCGWTEPCVPGEVLVQVAPHDIPWDINEMDAVLKSNAAEVKECELEACSRAVPSRPIGGDWGRVKTSWQERGDPLDGYSSLDCIGCIHSSFGYLNLALALVANWCMGNILFILGSYFHVWDMNITKGFLNHWLGAIQ